VQLARLRHIGEGLGQVDEGLAAVGGVEEEDCDVWAFGRGAVAVAVEGRGRRRFVGGDVWGAEGEGWLFGGGAVVGC